MDSNVLITKASGEKVQFSEQKLRNSLLHSGARPEEVDAVIEEIAGKLYPEMPTKAIYKLAFTLLKESSRHLAAKYHLKGAIMELGPSGFPFEKYVGELLRHQGYKVKVGEMVQGLCVQHEVDVIALLNNYQLMIECKYHNLKGTICDVKIPLYIQSRFKDIEVQWVQQNKSMTYQGGVVTNTRFSDDAIKYGNCAGLKLIGWDYPAKGSLKDMIDELGLYPITCLTALTKNEKQWLLERKIVLCQELCNNVRQLEHAGVSLGRMDVVLQEIHQLCRQAAPNAASKN